MHRGGERQVPQFQWYIAKDGKQVGGEDMHKGGHRGGGRFSMEFTRREGEPGEQSIIVEDYDRGYMGQTKFEPECAGREYMPV